MIRTEFLCSLALYESLVLHIEINKMFVFDTFPMKFNRKVVFACKWFYLSFL